MSQLSIRAALEIALQDMVGIIPFTNIVSSSNSIFLTGSPHRLLSNMDIKVDNHTTKTSGNYFAVVLSATTFSLKDKVTLQSVVIPAGVGGTVTAQLTAWENVGFEPLNGVPYQKVNFVFAKPNDITMGAGMYRERGFMQITLYYPQKTGPVAAMSRAELIRNTYPRGASFSNSGIVAHIDCTPEILPGIPTDESYIVIVRVPFYADIYLN